MKLIRRKIFCYVYDPFTLKRRLNELADEYDQVGCTIRWGSGGSLQVSLPDREIHYVPGEGCIKELVFKED
ncbi:hypothetical protein LLE49_25915 [Alicyclobacillus tolerans]|uniref:hypothetical protein n=1 Tax=Alicyclobacillus tolerans TaxID=90970 RepID=UPI001F212BC9|nr:hypothetical protein [Alicyclobacillus tolerans]MCF8568166.1 hypothetical protein [Alicyclobacillus tolerans]